MGTQPDTFDIGEGGICPRVVDRGPSEGLSAALLVSPSKAADADRGITGR
jgi:hypothetical protein